MRYEHERLEASAMLDRSQDFLALMQVPVPVATLPLFRNTMYQ